MYKTGLSTTGKDLSENLLKTYGEAGMEYMEVSTDSELYTAYDWVRFKKWADMYGVKLWSFHLPFRPFEVIDMSSSDKEKRKHSVEYYTGLIKKFADIGIDKFVLHSGGKVTRKSDGEVRERIKCAKESYALLSEVAWHEGGIILVENLPPVCVGTNIEEVRELVSADPRLKICHDTNHMLDGNPIDFIRAFGDRIASVHLSDYDRINERHWMPGEGVNDWHGIYDALNEVGYKGIWLYEVPFWTVPCGEGTRKLCIEDFKKNAMEIFNHQRITSYGKPVA